MEDSDWKAVPLKLLASCAPQPATHAANPASISAVTAALEPSLGYEKAREIAFHLLDWREEAAFLVALHQSPGEFTTAQIQSGVEALLIHAPNHLAAAAKLGGWPVQDIFEVDALSGPEPDSSD